MTLPVGAGREPTATGTPLGRQFPTRPRRRRFAEFAWLAGLDCPRCGGTVNVIAGGAAERAISLVVPVRRYQCADWHCSWVGRIRRRQPTGEFSVAPLMHVLVFVVALAFATTMAWYFG